MKLANVRGRATIVGDVGTGIDVQESSAGLFGPSMADVLGAWSEFVAWGPPSTATPAARPFKQEDLGPPSPEPQQVFAVGLNYVEHAAETRIAAAPDFPPVFTKYRSSLTGPISVVDLPSGSQVDWEAELVVVISRHAHRVAVDDAWDYVAGLTVGQDLSDRRHQFVGDFPQFSLAKSRRGFAPIGPWLVTPDELEDPNDLAVETWLNGELVQASRTSAMIRDVAALIAGLSDLVDLLPGDLIFTGTPAGVGMARTPPLYLSRGDELRTRIEGIGELRQGFA